MVIFHSYVGLPEGNFKQMFPHWLKYTTHYNSGFPYVAG